MVLCDRCYKDITLKVPVKLSGDPRLDFCSEECVAKHLKFHPEIKNDKGRTG